MEDPNRPPSTAGNDAHRRSRAKRILIALGVVLVLLGAAYLVGLLQGRAQVDDLEQELAESRQQLAESRQRLAEEADAGRMRSALALLYRTALDLEARNFGTANDRLDEAAALLAGIEAPESDLPALQRDVQALDLEVASDLQAQRGRVLALADSLRALLPPPGS